MALSAVFLLMAAGTVLVLRIWSRWTFSAGSKAATSPARIARHDHRDFPVEGDEAFEHQRVGRQHLEGERGLFHVADDALALAVIAEPRGLQHGGRADLVEFGFEPVEVGDRRKRRHRDAVDGEEGLFGQPVLRNGERIGAGAQRLQTAEELRRCAPARSRTHR